tara:strand:- start:400 stop:804 length:405 start_codon:yes stop_codon:yes gene_type:complete
MDNENLEFNTDVEGIDVTIMECDFAYPPETASKYREVSANEFKVHWTVHQEARKWGLKGASIVAYNIKGSFLLTSYDEDDVEISETEYLIDSRVLLENGWELDTEGASDKKLSDDVSPQAIIIDYKDKNITISF